MISAREACENFLPCCVQNLKICIKNQQFAAINFGACLAIYATIITLRFGLNPMIFAMPIYSI